MYPTKIEVNGNIYNINTDYRVALACFEAINDEKLCDKERFYVILCLLLGTDVKYQDEYQAYLKCEKYLRCGKDKNQGEDEIDMDYEQDKGYINTSFRSCYKIDIKNENLHWWEYNEMIEGLSEDTILSKVRQIRNIDLSEIKDEKEKQKIIKAKDQVALKEKPKVKSDEHKAIDEMFDNLLKKKGE